MKNAFITGAASGIGRATAETLYAQGWSLGLADINEQALKEMTLGWEEQRVRCYALDVTKPEQCTAVIGEFAAQHDKQLRLLFNSAGILQIDRFEDVSSQRHQQIFDINVMGTIHCCQAAFPYLRHTSGAQVINMSS
ncbi:MAG: short-chain dehydrogenase, partial [Thalassolituus sp. CG17_big_fil_post_rev_8_21_14_2_50_53_8]